MEMHHLHEISLVSESVTHSMAQDWPKEHGSE
jgi:hypothetical protein